MRDRGRCDLDGDGDVLGAGRDSVCVGAWWALLPGLGGEIRSRYRGEDARDYLGECLCAAAAIFPRRDGCGLASRHASAGRSNP